METVCSSANGERDAKAETLVGVLLISDTFFIYSEHEIAPLKLFAAIESF